nr:MAG TPA: reticulon-4-like protein [Bacteriophage sp.]
MTPHCIRIYYSVMEVVKKKPYWRRLLYLHLSL